MEQNTITETSKALIVLKEHEKLYDKFKEDFKDEKIVFVKTDRNKSPIYLGICPNDLCASYYIGAAWLTNECALVVTPKMENIDYIEMFMCSLKHKQSAEYFSKCYGINFNDNPIKEVPAFNSMLTPLLIIHYLGLVKNIVAKGLQCDYILKEENLQSKAKGKIKISQNIKYNNINKRNDRIFCQFQEYTVDTKENRLLKRALLFAKEFAKEFASQFADNQHNKQIEKEVNMLLTSFASVSEEIEIKEVKNIKNNKIYKAYNEALRVAKMILKRFNYSLSKVNEKETTVPPFWIDMSRLYEVYVYTKLLEAYGEEQISFQVKGYQGSAVDFIKKDESIIIDTKYKPKYNESKAGILDDVRQLSGYARDTKILKELRDSESIPSCLIIYPEKYETSQDDAKEDNILRKEDPILKQSTPFAAFKSFYKLKIPLPSI